MNNHCDHNHIHHTEPQKSGDNVTYVCPMHPEIRQDQPGRCPECGMNLVPAKSKNRPEKTGMDKHAGHSLEKFFRKFLVSLILTLPVLAYSELPQKLFGWTAPAFPFSDYLSLVLSSIIFFYGGWVFLVGAWREIRGRLPGMMTLIGLAISVAYFYSLYAVFAGQGHDLFWELTTLITIMLLGHWIEMKSVQGAQGALKELSKLLPDTAEVIRNGKEEIIPLASLLVGDLVLVRPGGKIPADGVVAEGKSEADESMVSGESRPVAKTPGQEVIAGTINGDGSLKIKVAKIGERTFLAGVMRLVAEAQNSKSRLQLLSDQAAFYLTIVAIAVGGATFVFWLWAQAGLPFALERLVAVLVITCPHALGLAIPLVASISTTLAARHGFLVKQRLALEVARKINLVLFDKTGTLTRGEYGVEKVLVAASGFSENQILQMAASVDSRSEHFVAKAIVKEAKKRNLDLSEARDFVRLPGRGVSGLIGGKKVFSGGENLLKGRNVVLPNQLGSEAANFAGQGKTVIYVIFEEKLLGVLILADLIREESREAIQALKKMGIKVAMLTGDSEGVAKWVAGELGIDEYFAKVLPQEKAGKVKLLQGQGFRVAMVGDGINDAPALAQADLGIAIGAGTNVAIESSGIILVKNDPRDIPSIIRLSRLTFGKMLQNLFWATGYNLLAIPLAAGVLSSRGFVLQPAFSAILMSLSTVIVSFNAVLLRRAKL